MSNTPKSEKRGNPVLALRLRPEFQDVIRAEARKDGLGIAQWVERAIRAYVDSDAGREAPDVGKLKADLEALTERVAALEGRGGSGKPKAVKREEAGASAASTTAGQPLRRMSPEQAEELDRLLREEGDRLNNVQIGANVGVTEEAVRKRRRVLGLPPSKGRRG